MRIGISLLMLMVLAGISGLGYCDYIDENTSQVVRTKGTNFYATDAAWAHCDWEQNKAGWFARYKKQGEDSSNPNLVEASWVMQALDGYVQNAIKQYNNQAVYKPWRQERETFLKKIAKENDAMRYNPQAVPAEQAKADLVAFFHNAMDKTGELGNSQEAMVVIMSLARYDFARIFADCSTHKNLDEFYDISATMKQLCDSKDYDGLKKFIGQTYLKHSLVPIGTWQLVSNPPTGAGN